MKPLLIALVFACLCGCQSKQQAAIPVSDSVKWLIADSIRMRLEDSASKLRMMALEEPAIDTYKREVYRYIYSGAFSPTWMLRVEQMPDSTYALTSKFILRKIEVAMYPKLLAMPHKIASFRNYFDNEFDTLIFFAGKQILNEDEWFGLLKELRGSYYWTFTDPMPNDGILDGDNLSLSSKSFWPRHYGKTDTLAYHEVSIHCPFKGSYTDAFEYLARKSRLFKKIRYRAGAIRWH